MFTEVIPEFPDFPTQNKQNFTTATAGTNFTVPAGVNWLGVKCWGAGGSGGTSQTTGFGSPNNITAHAGNGGNGSYAQIIMEVTPGEILQVRVGGGGSGTTGGLNGGGNGAPAKTYNGSQTGYSVSLSCGRSGAGGGYSGIFTNIANLRPLIIVGGGGGAGGSQTGAENYFSPNTFYQSRFAENGGNGGSGSNAQSTRGSSSIDNFGVNGGISGPFFSTRSISNINNVGTIANSSNPNGWNTPIDTGPTGLFDPGVSIQRLRGPGGGGFGGGVQGSGNISEGWGGGSGKALSMFADVAIETNSQLSNPALSPRKMKIVEQFNNGVSSQNDADLIAAGGNFCFGGWGGSTSNPSSLVGGNTSSTGRPGLVILFWNNP